MGWGYEANYSYAQGSINRDNEAIATYHNDLGVVARVLSLTLPLGAGSGSFYIGDSVTGYGNPVEFYVTCNGVQSSHVTVTNVSYALSGGTNPSTMKNYTVTFGNGIEVQPNQTLRFLFTCCKAMAYNEVLVWNRHAITGEVVTTPSEYTISYNANGGTGAPSSQIKQHGVNLTLSTQIPSRPGYTFQGWSDSPSGSKLWNAGGIYTWDQDCTLYAVWSANTYTIVYDPNGGSGSMSNTVVTYGVYTNLRICTFTRPGYSFTGWYVFRDEDNCWYGYNNANVQGWYPQSQIVRYTLYNDGASVANTAHYGTVTMYAQWEILRYTITYQPNGGSGSEQTQQVQYQSSFTTRGAIFSRSGYTLDYWTLNSTSGSVYNLNTSYTYNWSSDITLYAHWKPNEYTVRYNANGGSGAPGSQTKYHDQTLTLSSSRPTRTITITFNPNRGSVSPTTRTLSLSFLGWNTRQDGSGTMYQPGSSYTSNSSVTLYAQWGAATVGSLPVPSRTQCNFVAWYTSVNGGSQVSSSTTFSSSTTIYARWDYMIIYYTTGYEPYIANQIKHHQRTLVLNTMTLYRPGYDFAGWSTTSGSTTVQYRPGGNYTADAPATLYPVFTESTVTYRVTFDLQGGTYQGGGALVQQVRYGKSATPPNNPTKSGKTFVGWLGDYTYITQDITIVAAWDSSPIWIFAPDLRWIPYRPNRNT